VTLVLLNIAVLSILAVIFTVAVAEVNSLVNPDSYGSFLFAFLYLTLLISIARLFRVGRRVGKLGK